jgi:glucan 1,3-beta-glucosidase
MKLLVFLLFTALFEQWSVAITNSIGTLDASIFELLNAPLFQDQKYECEPGTATSEGNNDFHLRGTSLGGFLVLEPWITPSLFYQFLDATKKYGKDAVNHIGMDSLTFCKALGPTEANRQLRIHWQSWVTDEQIANLAAIGVETVRIPVADWMFDPYEPFIGCWDGAIDELNRALDLCKKYNLTVVLDLHAVRGSQVSFKPFYNVFLF